MVVELYTDGACSGNPGPGGWGWVTEDGRKANGGIEHTTNQRMEVQAVLEGLRVIPGRVNVVSDSTYVVKCFNDRWFEGWLKRGWKNSQKKPVANRDLWEPLIELYKSRSDEITFKWVKGHAGNKYNEIADDLAVAARDEQLAILAGAGSKAGSAKVDPLEAGWPQTGALWAVGSNQLSDGHKDALTKAIKGLDPKENLIVSGLRRGVELEAAELALEAGIPLAVVLPFVDPAHGWPAAEQTRFHNACDRSAWLVTLAGDSASPGKAVVYRNDWIARNVVGAVVVGDAALADELDSDGLSVIRIED